MMRRLPIVMLLAFAGTALFMPACAKPGAAANDPRSAARTAVPVRVGRAVKEDVPVQIRAIARVEPYATVTVKPQVGGQIAAVHFAEGQDVKTGDLLFSLDARPFEAALRQAEAELAKDTVLAEDAAEEAAWEADLLQQKVATDREYDKSRAAADALAATVRADQAAVERARIDLDYCSVRSPLDGRTGALLADQGNVVKINEAALVVINQIRPIYVSFSVPEQFLAEVKKYQAAGPLTVEAVIPQDEGPPERAELTFIDNQVDRTTGTIMLKGTFQNEKRRLWPGQFVNAILTLTTEPGAIVVPSQAVQTGQSGQFIFVVKADQTVDMRAVTAGVTLGNKTVIQRGIEAGDTVVTDGQLRLVPGAQVTIKEGPATTPTSQAGPS
jgi:multidrug efflux system membrane fusion protein